MLAISTRWNALTQPDGAALFDELTGLGFETIALSQHLTHEQVEQLKPLLREKPPCSIRDFYPSPDLSRGTLATVEGSRGTGPRATGSGGSRGTGPRATVGESVSVRNRTRGTGPRATVGESVSVRNGSRGTGPRATGSGGSRGTGPRATVGEPGHRATGNRVHLASLNTDERKEAIRRTVRTMELAVELEVPIVVLHLGEVDTYDRTYLLQDLYDYGEREFEAFSEKVAEATEWRKRKQVKHRDAALRSLDELNERALRMHLYIAIENRPRYYQMPNFDEVGLFFEEFYGSPMRYWHDVAHAALQECLGLCRAHTWLEAYAEHLIGVNLHDLQGLEAYHPPGTGDLDWDEVFAQVPADVVKVLEIQHGEAAAVQEAREFCQTYLS